MSTNELGYGISDEIIKMVKSFYYRSKKSTDFKVA